MLKFDSPLNNLRIASPCSADWEEMYGDERKRFCGDCKLNVYNLSGMTREAAESLVTNAEGRLCVRYYVRADGSIITDDCPVGWAKVKQRTRVYATALASLLIALFSGVLFASLFSKKCVTIGQLIPYATPLQGNVMTMGAIAVKPNSNSGEIKPLMGKPSMGEVAVPRSTPKTDDKFETGRTKALIAAGLDRKDS